MNCLEHAICISLQVWQVCKGYILDLETGGYQFDVFVVKSCTGCLLSKSTKFVKRFENNFNKTELSRKAYVIFRQNGKQKGISEDDLK